MNLRQTRPNGGIFENTANCVARSPCAQVQECVINYHEILFFRPVGLGLGWISIDALTDLYFHRQWDGHPLNLQMWGHELGHSRESSFRLFIRACRPPVGLNPRGAVSVPDLWS